MFRDSLIASMRKRWPDLHVELSVPPDPSLGDYSLNAAFALAKKERRPVLQVAEVLAEAIREDHATCVKEVRIVPPGFVNIVLQESYLQRKLSEAYRSPDRYGSSGAGKGRKVIVEYSSPNIAKSMHVGHLRSTIIGDALANVYDALGYDVIRWNYIGDWGTQFGNLIAAYKKWGSEAELEKDPVPYMESLYVRFHAEKEQDPALEDAGREEFRKLESGDSENRKLWERFRGLSLERFSMMYGRLGVALAGGDAVTTKGESDYEDRLAGLVEELSGNGIAAPGEGGALVADLSGFGIATAAMLRKSDGATVYLTRDLASLRERATIAGVAKILYVVANQQALHFEQLFAMAELMKQKGLIRENLPELNHVKFGLVLGADGKKFSTREGNAVALADVLNEAEHRAENVVHEKNPELDEARVHETAHDVALAAVKYNDLRQHPHSDITFDWDAMLDLSGNSGPYLQYTHARLANIAAKAGAPEEAGELTGLEHPAERALMSALLDFPEAVAACARLSALNPLALYLYELAGLANRYYEQVRVMDEEDTAVRGARVVLVATVAAVLKRGLSILGIRAPERI